MAEFVVNYVLGKITDAAFAEALLLLGVGEKVKRVKRDLKWVSAFLKDADAKRNKDARVKQWVEEVKEVTYMIEDVLDEYFVEMGGGRWMSCLKRIGHFPKEFIARHKLATEIDKINERMKEIKENTEKFGITSLESSSRDRPTQLTRPVENPDIGKMEVIGFEDDFENICKQLFDQAISRRSVISIVGPGGRGKTTLAKKIYKSAKEKRHFNRLIWVTISKEVEIVGILKKMLRKLREITEIEEKRDEEHFLTELYMSLQNKKYLIVLDDVWSSENRTESIWARLKNALPDDDNGSRVLITTRFISVATESDATNQPHQLRTLSEDEGRQLLLKKVFPNQFAKECPIDLLPFINQFAKKCNGWPLALVVLGGILSTKEPNYNTWDDLKMDWQIEGHECLEIISTSYEDLPSYLKPCFMYIASFPEDYKINASTLIQLWIAEGLIIYHNPTRTTEEIAQSYLEELVQRCMVQVSERSWSGRIKYCYVHDILHELAIDKAKEENFFLVFSKSNANSTSGSTSTSARRIAFHEFGVTRLPKESIIGPKVHSLISFGHHFPNFQKLRMVRVIHLENFIRDENFQRMKQSTTLRYFRYQCHTAELPNSFWNNKMLRYVKIEGYRHGNSMTGPSSSVKLENLEILKGVTARDEWTVRFPHFPRIRKLGIKISDVTNWEAMVNSIIKLKNLESLFLKSYELSHPAITQAFKNYERMQSLHLQCWWHGRQIGDSSLFPPRLLKLTLQLTFLEQDPMQELEKLPNLRVLRLLNGSYKGEQLVCSAGGFRRLQQLELFLLASLKELKIEEGAMPLLKKLEILACDEMVILPDLQYLTKLEELKIRGTLLEGPNRHKVEHIPHISELEESRYAFIF